MADWYIVQTNPNCEEKATRELRRHGFRVYIPKRSFPRFNRRKGHVVIVHRPLLTGYVLMRFPPDMMRNGVPMFGFARQCQGVKNFVRFVTEAGEQEPFPIDGRHVAALMRRQRQREFGDPAIEDKRKRAERRKGQYRRGRKFRIVEGPFSSFLAKINNLRKSGEVEVTIEIFGRPTKIVLDSPEHYLRPAA